MNLVPLYRGLTSLLGPAVSLYLARREARGKEERERIGERRGRTGDMRPAGPLVWIHAASVGESVSVLALIERLAAERPSLRFLMTTGTVTSARLLAARLPQDRARHQYVPLDHPAYVRRFLDHWQPDLALWVESELWPNLILETRSRGISMVLLNARMSAKSFRGWRRFPGLIQPILRAFDLCLAQDEVQATRLSDLGAAKAATVGDLKAAAAPLTADAAELSNLTAALRGRPLWLAASTHAGEEEAAATAHAALAKTHPSLLTVIAPRHPARAEAIVSMLQARGLTVARRSRAEPIETGTEIYLADTLGEMGLLYRLSPIAFIGGSLTPVGGHNPTEAALLGCALIHGPDMTNCAAIAGEFDEAGGALPVRDTDELAAAVGRLLSDPADRERRSKAALEIAQGHRQVLDRVVAALQPWLDRLDREAYAHRA